MSWDGYMRRCTDTGANNERNSEVLSRRGASFNGNDKIEDTVTKKGRMAFMVLVGNTVSGKADKVNVRKSWLCYLSVI